MSLPALNLKPFDVAGPWVPLLSDPFDAEAMQRLQTSVL